MAIPNELITMEAEGLFARVAQGDQRAASYFARLAAYRLNPTANPFSYGVLKKGGGANVDGYAEDSIVTNANPSDGQNVYDLVGGAGAAGAKLQFDGPKPRRIGVDTWEAPKPLTEAEMNYLKTGVATGPICPDPAAHVPKPPVVIPDRGEMMDEARRLDAFYKAPEGLQRELGLSINFGPDWEGVGAWLFDVYMKARVSGKSREDARLAYVLAIQQTSEWKAKHPNG